MSEKTTFVLSEHGGTDRYKLLSGLIVPRPIGWIGTTRDDGTYNLAPFTLCPEATTEHFRQFFTDS